MRVSPTLYAKVSVIGVCVFVVTFSTVAMAQHLIGRGESVRVEPVALRSSEIREIPVFFPQGRLYCAGGSLAYQKLYPAGWQRISSQDAVKIASESVDEACLGGDPLLCKEYRKRLSALRLAIRGCF